MVAFLLRMPAGVPGTDSRPSNSTIEPQIYDGTVLFTAYGLFAKIVAGRMQPLGAATTDTPGMAYGLLVRAFPTGGITQNDPLYVSVPSNMNVCNIMRRGYMMVMNNAGSPVKGGAVYVRIANPSAGKPLMGIEAVADATATNQIIVPGAIFMGPADATGNTEIAYNI